MNKKQPKPLVPDLKSLFFALPKAEQHVHLAGAYPIYKMREMFREQGVPEKEIAKATSPQDLYDDLTDFVNFYMTIAELVQTEEQIEEATYAICIKAAEDNVKYIELKLSSSELDPEKTQEKQARLAKKESMYNAVRRGADRAKKELAENGFKQVVKYMYTAERHESAEVSLEDAKLAVKWRDKSPNEFIGYDLAGDEVHFSVNQHKAGVDYAREHGLNITIHAGETPNSEELSNVESMKRCIELGATRIGHGLAACQDEELKQIIIDNNIGLEVSPGSNISTMSIEDLAEHPIKGMIEAGMAVSICSDDPAMFNTKITREYENLYKYGVIDDWAVIKKLVMTGVETSFATQPEKQELIEEFNVELEFIEQNPYFKNAIEKYLTPKK